MTVETESIANEPTGAGRQRRQRRRILIALGVVVALLAGAGIAVVGYLGSVNLTGDPVLPESTTVYYSDGVTVLAHLGPQNRTNLSYSAFLDVVTQAAVAADDPDFWTEMASPIAAAVVRNVYGLQGSAGTRTRVLAWRLEERLSKEQILELYLNGTPFGRDTFGVEAAANVYFGKSADKAAAEGQRLTPAEAMLLVALIPQPEPDPADPIGSPGNDPVVSERARQNSVRRWQEVRAAMVAHGYLTQGEADTLTFPDTVRPYDPDRDTERSRPAALVVNHVLAELAARPPFTGQSTEALASRGMKIVTTLNARLQALVERTADETVTGSVMGGQPQNLQAAVVAVEPRTGRVLAYYGGHDGKGSDYAGIYTLDGASTGFGAHPPGASFAPVVVGAALQAGISLNSRWNAKSPQEMTGRTGDRAVRNASRCPTGDACTVTDSVVASLNTTFYALTLSTMPAPVLALARDLGYQNIWNDRHERFALSGVSDMTTLTPSQFDFVVGLGQYPVTVVDQANAMATIAAEGRRGSAHYVRTVSDRGREIYHESAESAARAALSEAVARDLTYAMSRVSSAVLPGVAAAGKTGTWNFHGQVDQNSDAWMIGFTPQIGLAVWLGNRAEVQPIKDKTGATIWGSGLPATIFRDVLRAAPVELGLPAPPPSFGPPAFVGDVHPPGSV